LDKGLRWVCLGAILWGTAGLSAKWLIDQTGMDPLAIGAWRLLLSSPILLAGAFWESKRRRLPSAPIGRNRWGILLFGAAVAGYQAGYFSAVKQTMVSTATLLAVCTAPLLVAVVARTFLKERWVPGTVLALALGVSGSALLIGIGGLAGLADPRYWAGNVLALGAAVCYGGYTLIGKKLIGELAPLKVIGWSFSAGAVLLLPALELPPLTHPAAWLALLYLGWVPTGLAYMLYIQGLRHTTATRASVGALLEPLTATVLAVWLLGERLGKWEWMGAALLLSSLFILSWPSREKVSQQVSKV
jgi:drug/metabolite transporter, DME family